MIIKGIDYGDLHVPRLVGDYMENDKDEELEKGSDIDRVRTILADEEDGSGILDQIINESNDPRVKEVFEAIREDEQKHVAALQQLAEILGSGEDEGEDEGEEDLPESDDEEVPIQADADSDDELLEEIPEEDDIPGDDASDLIDDIREVLAEHEAEKADDEEEDDEDLPDFLKSEEEEDEETEKRCSKSITAQFVAKSADQQVVYGVVSEPGVIDLQGDRLSESEIRKACHKFMQTSQQINKEHEGPAKADIIESYIAPVDFRCGGQHVRKGSWVLGVKVHDTGLWRAIKKGEITGFSIAGTGTRTPF